MTIFSKTIGTLALLAVSNALAAAPIYDKAVCDALGPKLRENRSLFKEAEASLAQNEQAARIIIAQGGPQNAATLASESMNTNLKTMKIAGENVEELMSLWKTGKCDVVKAMFALSPNILAYKASNRDLGECTLEQTKTKNCEFQVKFSGKGYPFGKGCHSTIELVGQALHDLVEAGKCI